MRLAETFVDEAAGDLRLMMAGSLAIDAADDGDTFERLLIDLEGNG